MSRKAIIVGGGLGGLSCAIGLATAGFDVTVLEKEKTLGGKLKRVEASGYRFDRGPSTITMLHAFRRVFERAGRRMEDYIQTYELEPRTRNLFADGTKVDLSRDRGWMQQQIAAYSPEDAARYPAFLEEARRIYGLADGRFLNRLMLSMREKADPALLRDFMRVRPNTTLRTLLARYFSHPYTLAMFGRYATYVGASPLQAPAIFAMLAHVEADLGIYGVYGGTYQLVESMARLARELGVHILTDAEVLSIKVRSGRAYGVETTEGAIEADEVICNGDLLTTARLVPDRLRKRPAAERLDRYEPSLSGFVLLAGVRQRYESLLHHTVFFPERLESEFEDIFTRRVAPEDPALYICNSGYSEADTAPEGGSSLFILANAPYLSEAWNWKEQRENYANKLIVMLDRRGISGLNKAEVLQTYTPSDLQRDTYAHRGAIYGISSNSMRQTFFRPGNRDREIDGLWYVGGTAHPGGGTPLVTMSGQLVAERIASLKGGDASSRIRAGSVE
ncbi:phytoene dehydrogenase [Saccharibacillus sp. O16]|nr:phytoene dehydrogenase [Saccharibacillus sp. O16]